MRRLGTLLLTHSSRTTNLERCSRRFLRQRFDRAERLTELPPFTSLPPARPLYSGALSFLRIERSAAGLRALPLGRIKSRRKIQHAVFLDERRLLVGYEHGLERWRLEAPVDSLERIGRRQLSLRRVYRHPHLAGLHSVAVLGPRLAALACSAPDAVLLLDLASGRVERTLRLPAALYGHNYPLTPEMDLRAHYIDDEQQLAHLNSAHPTADGRLVTSTLIQGAIGLFELESGRFRELARGFTGCHGARTDDANRVYFADSPAGELVGLDEHGRVRGRFAVGSRWLHDAVQLEGHLYAFALADANELRIQDVESGALLHRRRFVGWPLDGLFRLARRLPFWLGNSTQALSFRPAAERSAGGQPSAGAASISASSP